ncbi:cell wall metabolism sensor histidine kinase WalK [Fusibacter sp. 3D3]|uniref:sensor histidine kinase n=1 Tax=Fusibacter sp. 3D3 TaxID=1048380 RepID=UPI000853B890|nr:ATP-binding protein [Fusibacter sp. 3D3]GAU77626.1 sensor histidine kinase [Fusibacter sp. 3D3]
MSNKLNYFKRLQNRLYNPFKKFKLTTRITVFNVILFTILILFVFLFVTLLTRQFLFYKNREELISKKVQVEEFINEDVDTLYQTPESQRVNYLYERLKKLYLFENYKFVVLVSDDANRTSYTLNKNYYDRFITRDESSDTSNITTTLKVDSAPEGTFLNLEIYDHQASVDHAVVGAFQIPFAIDQNASDVFVSKLLGIDVMHTTSDIVFVDGSKVYITLFLTSTLDEDYLLSLNSALFVSSIIGILLLSIFGRYFTRRALRPLVNLSYMAQNINNENLDYRIPSIGTNDEVDTLIKSLNFMLQNLEKSFDYQKRFVSDASHELRIPLTIILGYVDLLKTMGYDEKELLEESIDSIESEAKNMKNLVEKLLLLARVENRTFEVNFDRVSVEEISDKLIHECQLIYEDYTFESELDYKGDLIADKELIVQIFRALVDNAVKYTDPPGTITVTSKELRKYYEVAISDTGRGIPIENIPNLTNRFYRVDEDRNRKTGGVGLGLAIVESLMKVQGGKIQIESQEHFGTKIALLFPKDQFMK